MITLQRKYYNNKDQEVNDTVKYDSWDAAKTELEKEFESNDEVYSMEEVINKIEKKKESRVEPVSLTLRSKKRIIIQLKVK